MNPQQFAMLALTIMTVLGFLLIAGYFMMARTRSYLLYLGLSFLALGVLSISTDLVMRLITLAIFLGFFIAAAIVAVKDTKERLHALRQEHADREAAFAEFLQSTVGKEGNETAEAAPEVSSPAEPEEAE